MGRISILGSGENASFAIPCVIESCLEKGTFSLLAVRLQRVHSFIPSFVHSEHSLAHSLACFAQRAAVERPVARRAKHARLGTSLIPFTHSFTMPLRFEFPLTYPSLTHSSSSFVSQALFLRVAAQSVVGRLECPQFALSVAKYGNSITSHGSCVQRYCTDMLVLKRLTQGRWSAACRWFNL